MKTYTAVRSVRTPKSVRGRKYKCVYYDKTYTSNARRRRYGCKDIALHVHGGRCSNDVAVVVRRVVVVVLENEKSLNQVQVYVREHRSAHFGGYLNNVFRVGPGRNISEPL
jgi:hypothetical protein